MDLGGLPELMDRLAGMGAGITIAPVLEEVSVPIRGLDEDAGTRQVFVAAWEITYESPRGRFTVGGKTIPEAVDAAFANPDAW
jgi:hypothetical protein